MKIRGFVLDIGEPREIPKHGLSWDEVVFALGQKQLALDLREIGALKAAKKHGRSLVYDAGAVARVWADFLAGKFDKQLEAIGR